LQIYVLVEVTMFIVNALPLSGSWCVSVPLAYVFAFTMGLGFRGIWLALSAGLFSHIPLSVFFETLSTGYAVVTFIGLGGVLNGDWTAIALAARERSGLLIIPCLCVIDVSIFPPRGDCHATT
jgi:hypothetical protein